MIPRWMQLMLGIVTDAEQPPEPCPYCDGTGWTRRTALTPEYRYIHGDMTLEEFERLLERPPASGH